MSPCLPVLLVAALALWGSGCAAVKGYPKPSYNVKQELQALAPYHSPERIHQYHTAPDKRAFRDEVVYARLRTIDLHFTLFEQALSRERSLGAVGVDWAVLGLSGAGTLTPTAGSKAILAALSGGLTGARASVSQHIYYQKTIPVLLATMEAERRKVMVRIREGLVKSETEYSLIQALLDLDDYYKAGSIPGALIAIAATSGETLKKAEEEIRGVYLKDSSGDILRRYWKPKGVIDQEFQGKLREWMTKNNIPTTVPITFFIRAKEYAPQREQAVKALGLTE